MTARHESFRANYGLYFNFWDRLLGTNHPQYAERFAALSGGVGPPSPLRIGRGSFEIDTDSG